MNIVQFRPLADEWVKLAGLCSQLDLVCEEEHYWKVMSIDQWIKEGDDNTTYFHCITNACRQRNHILSVHCGMSFCGPKRDCQGVKLFLQGALCKNRSRAVSELGEPRLATVWREGHGAFFTEYEIRCAAMGSHAEGTPRADGFSMSFFQDNQDLVKRDLIGMLSKFFDGGGLHVVNFS